MRNRLLKRCRAKPRPTSSGLALNSFRTGKDEAESVFVRGGWKRWKVIPLDMYSMAGHLAKDSMARLAGNIRTDVVEAHDSDSELVKMILPYAALHMWGSTARLRWSAPEVIDVENIPIKIVVTLLHGKKVQRQALCIATSTLPNFCMLSVHNPIPWRHRVHRIAQGKQRVELTSKRFQRCDVEIEAPLRSCPLRKVHKSKEITDAFCGTGYDIRFSLSECMDYNPPN